MIFLRRLMQFTGPLTAKGVEDTTFYVYNPLIAHNEVGDTPAILGTTVAEFHDAMEKRHKHSPCSMNSTATHDTKRGEDARMRLNVLTEITEEWKENINQWREANKHHIKKLHHGTAPTINDEYLIYQSLVAGFPHDFKLTDEYLERVNAYFIKALREAKVSTNWNDPNEEYENACANFINSILHKDSEFLKTFLPFVKKVSSYASLYSLNQTLIKITAPGIPDIYQGCELWDLSYVDPDNRRPVNYEARQKFLAEIITPTTSTTEILPAASKHRLDYIAEHRQQGLEKLYVTFHALQTRKENNEVFTSGDYIPLAVSNERSAIAFARKKKSDWLITIAPLQVVQRTTNSTDFENIFINLPKNAPEEYINVLTGKRIVAKDGRIDLRVCLEGGLPGLLKSDAGRG